MSNSLIDEKGLQAAADWLANARTTNKTALVDFGAAQIIEEYLKAADQVVVTEKQYQQWVQDYNDCDEQLKKLAEKKRIIMAKMNAYRFLKEQGL